MEFWPLLAHGALGGYDELVYAGVAVIFVVMMGISWVRSQNLELEDEPSHEAESDENPDHITLE